MDPAKFDYSALAKKYTNRELWSHYQKNTTSQKTVIAIIAIVIMPILLVGPVVLSMAGYAVAASLLLPDAPPAVKITLLLLLVAGSSLGTLFAFWKMITYFTTKTMRNRDFAAANGLTYMEGRPTQEQGLLFGLGHSQTFTGGFIVPGPGRLTMANYQYTTGSGRSTRVYDFGIIRCDISRRLPNVLLDATSNNFMKHFSNLGSFGDNQNIKLEGDFDQYFNVHCPPGYGTDVLYWLTPELMQLLKQYMSTYDIEVIDNHVYAYSETPFQLNKAGIQNGLQIANWLHAEFEQNTHRYNDDRVANASANVVAEQGRRLKHKKPWVLATVFLIIYIIIRTLEVLHR